MVKCDASFSCAAFGSVPVILSVYVEERKRVTAATRHFHYRLLGKVPSSPDVPCQYCGTITVIKHSMHFVSITLT